MLDSPTDRLRAPSPYAGVSRIRFDGSSAATRSSQPGRLPGDKALLVQAGAARQPMRCSAMHVVELFLPLTRNDGSPQPAGLFGEVRAALVERFGGLTAFSRAPAEGLWEDDGGAVDKDRIVIFEVMDADFDADWWRDYRRELEGKFAQDEVLVRASAVTRV